MAYVRPLVLVYQEYESLSTSSESTTLYPCIIGPCYHIIDADDDADLAYIGTLTELGMYGYLNSE